MTNLNYTRMKLAFNPSYVLTTFIAVCVWVGASAQTAQNTGNKPVSDNRTLVRAEKGEKPTGEKKILTGATELQPVRPRPVARPEETPEVPTALVRNKKH